MKEDRLESEVKFLKNFGKRFAKKETYFAAIGDMLREGLITKRAHDIILEEKNKQTQVSPPQRRNKYIRPTSMAKQMADTVKKAKQRKDSEDDDKSDGCSPSGGRRGTCTMDSPQIPSGGTCNNPRSSRC